jgi:hypothetical protein
MSIASVVVHFVREARSTVPLHSCARTRKRIFFSQMIFALIRILTYCIFYKFCESFYYRSIDKISKFPWLLSLQCCGVGAANSCIILVKVDLEPEPLKQCDSDIGFGSGPGPDGKI